MPRKIENRADEWATITGRNTKLWTHLNSLGLYVDAIRPTGPDGKELEDKIDCLIVSVAPPTVEILVAESPASGSVGTGLEGTEIVDVVTPALGLGGNVADFPSV